MIILASNYNIHTVLVKIISSVATVMWVTASETFEKPPENQLSLSEIHRHSRAPSIGRQASIGNRGKQCRPFLPLITISAIVAKWSGLLNRNSAGTFWLSITPVFLTFDLLTQMGSIQSRYSADPTRRACIRPKGLGISGTICIRIYVCWGCMCT